MRAVPASLPLSARSCAQSRRPSFGIRAAHSSAPSPPSRSYAIGIVLALIIFGGNGVLYELKPAALVSADQMREAAEIPGGQDQQKARIPTFGESMGSAKPKP